MHTFISKLRVKSCLLECKLAVSVGICSENLWLETFSPFGEKKKVWPALSLLCATVVGSGSITVEYALSQLLRLFSALESCILGWNKSSWEESLCETSDWEVDDLPLIREVVSLQQLDAAISWLHKESLLFLCSVGSAFWDKSPDSDTNILSINSLKSTLPSLMIWSPLVFLWWTKQQSGRTNAHRRSLSRESLEDFFLCSVIRGEKKKAYIAR